MGRAWLGRGHREGNWMRGKAGVQLEEGKLSNYHFWVITNSGRANNVSHIHLKVTSDGKGGGRPDT